MKTCEVSTPLATDTVQYKLPKFVGSEITDPTRGKTKPRESDRHVRLGTTDLEFQVRRMSQLAWLRRGSQDHGLTRRDYAGQIVHKLLLME